MGGSELSRVSQIVVPGEVISNTLASLRAYGTMRCEGLVLWLGTVDEASATVLVAYTPPQNSISSEEGFGYFVTGETLFALNRSLMEHNLRLIAQVHSHPREAYHSATDDDFAIVTSEGRLSLVVPNFGDASPDPLTWAVYRLTKGRWQEVSETELESLIQTVERP